MATPRLRKQDSIAILKLCTGREGYPHLIVDGNLSKAGDFLIPSVLFLYIAGWIGWVGRAYLQAAKKSGSPEEKEIIIDVPKAVALMLSGFLSPLFTALKEITTGEMFKRTTKLLFRRASNLRFENFKILVLVYKFPA